MLEEMKITFKMKNPIALLLIGPNPNCADPASGKVITFEKQQNGPAAWSGIFAVEVASL